MKKIIASIALVVMTLLGTASAAPAAPAPAKAAAVQEVAAAPSAVTTGNGYNDFYLYKSQNVPWDWTSVVGVRHAVSNWDYGSNQKYHIVWRRSGVAYEVVGVYINGKWLSRNDDIIITASGHDRNYMGIKVRLWGQTWYRGFWL